MVNDVRPTVVVRIMSGFDSRLTEIGRYWTKLDQPQKFDQLVDALDGDALPLLRRFPAIGRRLLNTRPDTVHALLAYEKVAEAEIAGKAPELREYLFNGYVLLYLLTKDAIYLVSIRHCKEVSFDFDYLWGAER